AALGNSTGTLYLDDLKLDKTITEADYVAAKAFITNPGFENGIDGWPIWYGDATTETAHSGKASLKVSFPEMGKWQMRRQRLSLPKGVRNFEMSVWVKLQDAATSPSSWEGPRVYVEYVDKNGQIIPGLQQNVFRAGEEKGKTTLTKDWFQSKASFLVPGKAVEMEINAGLANTKGTIYIDDLEVQWEKPEDMVKSIKKGWYAVDVRPEVETGHYVDWSNLLDAPAGKHGFVKSVNGHHVFEDGTPAKFWGTNFMAELCFSSKDVVDSLTTRLAKMGNNIIRVHHMDAPWNNRNIFGNAENTRKLSEERLEQLDYLMAKCKEKGIYIYLDLLVHRDFKKEDGVPYAPKEYGGKQVAVWDPKIIELQKEFYNQIFNHVNQYTGLAYKDDPVIVGSVIVNETWAGGQWNGDYLTPEYAKQLDEMFAKSEFSNNGLKKRSILTYKEGPGYYKRILSATNRESDSSATMRFLHSLETKYVDDMYGTIRKLGVKYPIAYTNFPMAFTSLLKSKSRTDMILNNSYWSHPWVYEDGKYSMTTNTSMSDRYTNNLVQENATYVVEGKPFMVSEWNDCYPNETRIEGPVAMAAYGALQGWDGFMAFTFPENN
ncbi:MAG: cellulase family glycosylhydrolase, partial [Cytophagales bacterium]|nr:cellulase family glycosylhydrolase [Cytophagales bacterium]